MPFLSSRWPARLLLRPFPSESDRATSRGSACATQLPQPLDVPLGRGSPSGMRLPGSSTALLCTILASACGPKATSNPPAAPSPAVQPMPRAAAPTKPQAAPTEPQASPEPPTAPPPTPEAAEPTAAEPTLRELCERVCARLETQCSQSVAQSCRRTCERYDGTPEPCHEVGRDAFACWETVNNPLCANIVPDGCAKPFRLFTSCRNAPESFVYESPPDKTDLAGFERFSPEGETFVAMMPGDVDKTEEGPEVVWSAHADGVRYFIRKLPAAPEEFTAKSQVRLAMKWLAPCTGRLKLHGQVDTDDGVSVHYDGACDDASERHGVIHITKGAVFIIGTEGPSDNRGQFDAFAYGFQARRAE